ncbi:MAG: histidinol-phosphate transaminase [Balneolaceae bacterium]
MSDSDSLNIEIPENIRKLTPYVAGKTIDEVKQLYKPERISKLASNENRMGCSPDVAKAVHQTLQIIQDYPDPVARKLRAVLAKKNGVYPENILLAAGSESVISIICRTFFKPHEIAVTADATFVGFFVQAGVQGIEVKKVPVTNAYEFDIDGILNAVDKKTKAVYIANPNNPTGTYINNKSYKKLLESLPETVLLITDEAYYEYAIEEPDYPSAIDDLQPNVIILRTFSKAYGLAGFRIGYAIAHKNLIQTMMKVKLTFEPTSCAQAAALAAINDTSFLTKSVKMVNDGKVRLYNFLKKHNIRYVESVSNSVMICLENENEAADFTQAMLEEGVIIRQAGAFGLPNCVRITIGLPEDMKHFEKSFEKVMQESLPSLS